MLMHFEGSDFMQKYMRCTHCGYDLYGHEYIANMIDANSVSHSIFSSEPALLESCTKSPQNIVCPFCKESGYWTSF